MSEHRPDPSRRPARASTAGAPALGPSRRRRSCRPRRTVATLLLGVVLLTGCGGPTSTEGTSPAPAGPGSPTSDGSVGTTRALRPLPANGRFDYQIGGPYAPADDVVVVGRDRREQPVPGRWNLCYVNAFQTQPEDAAFWTEQHPDLLLRRGGRPVEDPGWPGELLLDTSSEAKREALLEVVGPWVDDCAARGFDGVEPDNLDSWTRSDGLLRPADDLAFAGLLVQRAHALGLVVGQKNAGDIGRVGRTQVGFDFAIAEECQAYEECDAYTDVYGERVLEVEYTDNPRSAYEDACAERGDRIAVVLRDRDVVPRGRPGYTYESC